MDINSLRIGVTVAGLIAFVLLVFWVYSKNNRAHFHEAGKLPFLEDQSIKPGAQGDKK
jgi:cbb3-type cytochrome oxidase subunit 3